MLRHGALRSSAARRARAAVTLGNVSAAPRPLPKDIILPREPPTTPRTVQPVSGEQETALRASCAIVRDVLATAKEWVKPGVTTDEIDRRVHEAIVSMGAYPSPLNYRGFPRSCCTSVNEVV